MLPKTRADNTASQNEPESDYQISAFGNKVVDVWYVKNIQNLNSGAAMASTSTLLPATPKMPQPKIDATDRRQIEAQNEDKSHATKEELYDIKRTHYKEKKKKEQNNVELSQTGINNGGWVRKASKCLSKLD